MSVDIVCVYIVFLSQFMSFGSVSTYVHGLPFMCYLLGLKAPNLQDPQIKLTLNGIKRLCSRAPHVKDPIDLKLLNHIYRSVRFDCMLWLHFWTACLVMFRCLLRISNIIFSPHSLKVRDVEFNDWGCLLSVRSAKCSKPGSIHVLPLAALPDKKFCPVFWLKKLIVCCKLNPNDYLFCMHPYGLTYRLFRSLLKESLKSMSGIKISSHSFRIGGATLLYNLGLPLAMIKERGGWRSWSVLQYLRDPLHLRISREKVFCKIFSGFC